MLLSLRVWTKSGRHHGLSGQEQPDGKHYPHLHVRQWRFGGPYPRRTTACQNYPLNSGKGSAYEGGIREPMIVRWPGIVAPQTQCDHYLMIEDFFPTILEMAGVDNYTTVQQRDGISFMPLLTGKGKMKDRDIYWHYPIAGVLPARASEPLAPSVRASGSWCIISVTVDGNFSTSPPTSVKNMIWPERSLKLSKSCHGN